MKSEDQRVADQSTGTDVRSILSALIMAAVQNPDEWYTNPECSLALRVMASLVPSTAIIAFELRKKNSVYGRTHIYRYRYDSRSNSFASWKQHAWNPYFSVWHHDSLNPSEINLEIKACGKLPDKPEDLARFIATLVHYDPKNLQCLQVSASSQSPGHNLWGIIEQWIGPSHQPLSNTQKFLLPTVGSIMLLVPLALFSAFLFKQNGNKLNNLEFYGLISIIVIIALSVGWVIYMGIRDIGPIRLLFIGFLLTGSILGLIFFFLTEINVVISAVIK